MTPTRTPIMRTCAAIALGLGIAAAQAAGGVTITKAQEALVVPGMRMDQVQQALGRPQTNAKYRNEPGRTFTYRVLGNDPMLFDVDFDADGRVLKMGERMDLTGGGLERRRSRH